MAKLFENLPVNVFTRHKLLIENLRDVSQPVLMAEKKKEESGKVLPKTTTGAFGQSRFQNY